MILSGRYEVELARLRVPAGVMIAGGLVLAHLPQGVGVPCPLRTLTGVPCPFCGLTTSIRSALGGRLSDAVRAAPLGLVVLATAAAALVGAVPRSVRIPNVAIFAVLAGEWVFELARFHII